MVSGAGAGAAIGVPRQSFEIDDSHEETIQNASPKEQPRLYRLAGGREDNRALLWALLGCFFGVPWLAGHALWIMGLLGAMDRSEIELGKCAVTGASIDWGCVSCCRRRLSDANAPRRRLDECYREHTARQSACARFDVLHSHNLAH